MVLGNRTFIFHIYIPWGNPFFSTKVKVICQSQGQISRSQFSKKDCPAQTHLVFISRVGSVIQQLVQNVQKNKFVATEASVDQDQTVRTLSLIFYLCFIEVSE